MDANIAHDILGNQIEKGDKVLCVFGRTLRKSVIEKILYYGERTEYNKVTDIPNSHVKIEKIKQFVSSHNIIKINW